MIGKEKLFNLFDFKYLLCFHVFIIAILFQTHCIPPPNDVTVARTTTMHQQKKGLNYQSMIKTFSARLCNRFQTEQDSSEKIDSPDIYLTSASIHQNKLTQLNQMIINDLKQSLEKDRFIVQIPTVIANAENITPSECETRLAALDQKIKINLSSKACELIADCLLITLDISYQGKTISETCHLSLTSDLVQKNNHLFHIPVQMGHQKKPFYNIDQSFKLISKTLQCMFNTLLQTQGPHRLLFAKTENTPKSFVDKLIMQFRNMTGNENVAKTIIPIDCYGDQFVIRDVKISESIPDDISILIAMDSIEIHPGKYRIRIQALSLKNQLFISLKSVSSVPFGKCMPGCRFHFYSYTRSKGKSLTGEGSGECNKNMPKHLWSYSAKTMAESSARKALFNKVKHHMRKHYIANDLPFFENTLDEKSESIMKNAIMVWENFDDTSCHADARYIIYDSFLPFVLSQEPQQITSQVASTVIGKQQALKDEKTQSAEPQSITSQVTELNISNSASVQKSLTPTTEPQSITLQSTTSIISDHASVQKEETPKTQSVIHQENQLAESFRKSIKDKLKQDIVPKSIIQLIEIMGIVECKECIADSHLGSNQMRCKYKYDLSFVMKNYNICICKGTINAVGNNVESAHRDCISALIDLFYPFPLDIALALNNKLSQEDLKQMLVNLDKKYFQLTGKIDAILELIRDSRIGD